MTNTKQGLVVRCVGTDAPIRFAAAQLRNYLKLAGATGVRGEIRVGTMPVLGLGEHDGNDRVIIDIVDNDGVIAGDKPRSALLAVYRYLRELGFDWVRPGRDGEVIPQVRNPLARGIKLDETASYRHRVVCIEGSCHESHVRNMIDWLPKLGLNGYYMQFRSAYTFFDRWHYQQGKRKGKIQPLDTRKAQYLTERMQQNCVRRGLDLHMVGHGWTCEPFGVPALGWYVEKQRAPTSIRPHLALVNGKRDYWGGKPINTNLCYGNARTRRIVIDDVVQYASDHPEVNAVHFWIGDNYNNHCQCSKCRGQRPADLYVTLLNELDSALTKAGLDTKIVFLLYLELLWPPLQQRITNPDRFIMMFAPISRSYSRPISAKAIGRKKPFHHNKITLPKDVGENLAYLRAWQRSFRGDSFVFDYHLMWDQVHDPGHYQLAKVMHADMRNLAHLGLNGMNSCQAQRCCMPTGLIMTTMARTLWDRKVRFDDIVRDHYRATFGADWKKAAIYTQKLSELFDPPFMRGERQGVARRHTLKTLEQVPVLIRRFLPVIEKNLSTADRCQARSWRYMGHHANLCLAQVRVVRLVAADNIPKAKEAFADLIVLARKLEPKIHPVYDVYVMIDSITNATNWPKEVFLDGPP